MGTGNKRRTERNRANAENKPEWVRGETMNRKGNPSRNRKEKKAPNRHGKTGAQKYNHRLPSGGKLDEKIWKCLVKNRLF